MSRSEALLLELRWALRSLIQRRRADLFSDLVKACYLSLMLPIELIGSLLVRRKAHLKNVKKILVLKTDQLGDVLFATLLIAPLRKRFPDAEIHWLVQPKAMSLLANDEDVAKIIPWHELTFALLPGRFASTWRTIPHLVKENMRTIKKLRATKYDLAINARVRPPSGNVIWKYIGAPLVSWNNLDTSFLAELPAHADLFEPLKAYANLLAPLGIHVVPHNLHPRYRGADARHADEFTKPLALLAPATYDADRSWDIQKWQHLIRYLTEQDYAIAINGIPEQRPYLDKLTAHAKHDRVRIIDDFSIPELAGVLKRADLFVGIDSFPAHLALALGIPGVCLINTKRYYVEGLSKSDEVFSSSLFPVTENLPIMPLTCDAEELIARLPAAPSAPRQ